MAKPKTPAPAVETPSTDTPAPDMSILVNTLAPILGTVVDLQTRTHGANRELAVACHEFRIENPTASRGDIRLAIQTAISTAYGLKLSQVQNDSKPTQKGYTAYTLASALLSVSWPKGESEQKRVAKAIEEEKGWVELRKAASKKQSRPAKDPNANKITAENFGTRFASFLTQAQVDMDVPMEKIVDMAESALSAIKKAPK